MIYEFENKAGERIEAVYRMGRAPKTIRRQGVLYRRVPSMPRIKVAPDLHFVSDQLPLHWKYANDHDEQGRCRFSSKREVLETAARARAAGEHVEWNPELVEDTFGKKRHSGADALPSWLGNRAGCREQGHRRERARAAAAERAHARGSPRRR